MYESSQYIAKYEGTRENLQILQHGLEKTYTKKQSGNKLSKAKKTIKRKIKQVNSKT